MFPPNHKGDLLHLGVTSLNELGRVINEEREREIEGWLRLRRLLGLERRRTRRPQPLEQPRPRSRPVEAGG